MKYLAISCQNCNFGYSETKSIIRDLFCFQEKKEGDKFDNYQECLKNISFDLLKGEKLGVIGLNGSGKSSLLLALSGNLIKKKGSLLINNVFQLLFEMGEVDSPFNTGYEIIESYYYMLLSFHEGGHELDPLEIYKKKVASFI